MVADKIIFNCAACNTRLTVPATMAGVEGPCPTCGAAIRAPRTGTQIPAAKGPVGPPLPPVTMPSLRAPLPPMPPPVDPALLTGPRIRPEPREPFGRPADARPPLLTPRKTTEDEGLRRNTAKGQRVRRPRGLLYRLLMPAGALGLAGLVVFVILQASKHEGKPGKKDYSYPEIPEAAAPRKKAPAVPPAAILPASESITPLKTPATADTPDLTEAPAPAAIPISPLSDRLAAEKVLEQFLQAEDAETRVALSEPATEASSLADTPLAGQLEINSVEPEDPHTNMVAGFTEFPFYVDVKQKDRSVQYTMIVRKHGDQPPKVFLPPIVDLLGGGLASYASKPQKEYGTFHVVLGTLADCFEDVPNSAGKFTFKLLPSPLSKEIAKSYVSNAKTARFAKMLDDSDPSSPLRWGVKTRARVTLRWNFLEDPSKPYLELIEIKSFNWDS